MKNCDITRVIRQSFRHRDQNDWIGGSHIGVRHLVTGWQTWECNIHHSSLKSKLGFESKTYIFSKLYIFCDQKVSDTSAQEFLAPNMGRLRIYFR